MSASPSDPGHRPGRQPFGAVRLPHPVPPAPRPARARRLPDRHPGPSVPLPVLSLDALRQPR
ncbi:hypothetical protein [Streptacidiphilus sp. P02-A3a]|uniref:hypothetical protein n=1 Tax=Streptacidiphilus sp. P02-A3a TaxID=2704468 RepID=UPI0015FD2597|nr:hypothetical protein [Streptacidiphilus sp. P02-A3a]QMU71921.1 hypothetical protein GXP74_30480 [Streptacidiphilus sp. P02-A3a]